MARKSESVVPVDAQDLVNRLVEFQRELGCEARIVIDLVPGSASDLRIIVQAYTDHGARIGVARQIDVHRPRPSKGLMGHLMQVLHKAFWQAEKNAHLGMSDV